MDAHGRRQRHRRLVAGALRSSRRRPIVHRLRRHPRRRDAGRRQAEDAAARQAARHLQTAAWSSSCSAPTTPRRGAPWQPTEPTWPKPSMRCWSAASFRFCPRFRRTSANRSGQGVQRSTARNWRRSATFRSSTSRRKSSSAAPTTGTARCLARTMSTPRPASNGTNATSPPTAENLRNSGYLLRGWLSVQKIAEVKRTVLDGLPAPKAEPRADRGAARCANRPASRSACR